jgi:hypothetical protein
MWKQIGLLLLLAFVWPVQAEDTDHDLTEARAVFLKGVDGNARAVRDATRRFQSLSQAHPQEPVFIAYLGASMTLQGRDAANNIERQRLTEEGLREVDRALKLQQSSNADPSSPRYLDTLLVGANTYIHLPAFFNRYDQGKRLLQEIQGNKNFDAMAAGYKAAVYMAAALVAHGEKDEDAYRHYLDLTVSTDPDGRDGKAAKKMMQELGQSST